MKQYKMKLNNMCHMANNPILSTHKSGIIYIEYCRIGTADARLTYIKAEKGVEKHISIPSMNTCILLLGPGTSITQAAARVMSDHNILYAFTGSGGFPAYSASLNEYRPTEYLQRWIKFWPDDKKRLKKAAEMQRIRADFMLRYIHKHHRHFYDDVEAKVESFKDGLRRSSNISELMGYEGRFIMGFLNMVAKHHGHTNFKRQHQSLTGVNGYITYGHYMSYGISSVALWSLGLPHSLPLTHGETRRGGLVFDVADMFKDCIDITEAFEAEKDQLTDQAFRMKIIDIYDRENILKFAIQSLQEIAQ